MSQWYDVKSPVLYKNRYCDQNEFDISINHHNEKNKDSTNSSIQIN